jgi:hypothetical protein
MVLLLRGRGNDGIEGQLELSSILHAFGLALLELGERLQVLGQKARHSDQIEVVLEVAVE